MKTTKSTKIIPHTEVIKGMPAVSYLMFTPQECKDFLAAVEKDGRRIQRPLSRFKIQSYANAMQEGRWRADSAEPVKFDPDGLLMDGFHRMNAVIRAGIPVMLCMASNVPKDVEPILDSGKSRSPANSLTMAGYMYASCLAVACRSIWLFENRVWRMDSYVDNGLIMDVAKRYENLQAYTGDAWNHSFIRAGSLVGTLFWIEQCNQTQGALFNEGVLHGTRDGIGLSSTDIVYMLREAMIRDRGNYMNTFLGRNMIVCTVFRTFNRFLKGDSVQRIKFTNPASNGGQYPWPEGGPYAR